jgi:hypothetical protein
MLKGFFEGFSANCRSGNRALALPTFAWSYFSVWKMR